MRILLNLSGCVLLFGACALGATGLISGFVTDENGAPVVAADVVLIKRTEFQIDRDGHIVPKELGRRQRTKAGGDGSFRFENLPGGRYELCASGNSATHLGSCAWIPAAAIVLSEGQSITGIQRKLLNARVLSIRVKDRSKRINQPGAEQSKSRASSFRVGVLEDNGNFNVATRVGRTGDEEMFQIAVPSGRALELFLDTDLPVTDESGVDILTRRRSGKRLLPTISGTAAGTASVLLEVR